MKIYSLCSLVFLFCLLSTTTFASTGISSDEVVLGMSNALSGPSAALGTGMKQGATVFFDNLNKAGGVNGRKVKLISYDDAYDPEKAVANTKKLLDSDKVFTLFGYVGTPTASAVIPLVDEHKIPFVGPFTGAEFLRSNKNVFNIRASYIDETEHLVNYFVSTLKLKKIGIFIQNDAYGAAGETGVVKALTKRGMTVVGKGTYERGTTDVEAGLEILKKANPDAVIMIGAYKGCSAFVQKANAAGFKPKFANVSFVGTSAFIKDAGSAGEGVYISQVVPSPWDSSIAAVSKYQKEMANAGFRDFDYTSLEGYIAAKVISEALKKDVKDLPTFVAAMENTNVDVGGFKVRFSPDSHNGSKKVYLTVVKGGKVIPLR